MYDRIRQGNYYRLFYFQFSTIENIIKWMYTDSVIENPGKFVNGILFSTNTMTLGI